MSQRLFARQVARSTGPDGTVDLAQLGALVVAAYDEADRDRRRTERAIELMIEELDALNSQDRERLLTELRTQNLRFEAALENMSQGLSMFDGEHRLIVCNRRYAELYGLPPEVTRAGTPVQEIARYRSEHGTFPEDRPDRFLEDMRRIAIGTVREFRIRHLRDGRIVAVDVQPMAGGGWLSTHQDITEQRKAEAQINRMARHDTLTDLPNRLQFQERLIERLRSAGDGERTAVLALDLDHFKEVNDTLGHLVGDGLLLAVAERLRGVVAEGDIVARLGGDEFAILQADPAQPVAATILAQKVIEALSRPYCIDGHQVVIGTSVGIAVAPSDGDEPVGLIRNADLALYRAKDDGRGTYRFFEAGMDERMKLRRALELDLRTALVEHQFEVYYQPVIDLKSRKINGLEALLRWNHPTRGLVTPQDFIPLAEEIGLIVPIGEWVLRQACAEVAHWSNEIAIAVNLSPVQFRSGKGLLPVVTSALAASGLAPQRLMLEITETVLLQDNARTLAVLHQLRALGVRICMDDFGTGFSSLGYLRRFPFDKIKIDRSFIRDFPGDSNSLSIVRAVTGLGASLGMTTTAEGVETAEQAEILLSEGCTEVQGFLYSPPVPASAVPGLLEGARPRLSSVA